MSVELVNVTKHYRTLTGKTTIYRDLNLKIERNENVGIIGRNGAGKSTLLKLIAGVEKPDSGRVIRKMSISWPLGFTNFFALDMTGTANAAFCARLYGRSVKEVTDFAREWSGLGEFMDWPVKGYSTGMRAKLGFALSLAIKFECMLVDEVLGVGDAIFRQKAQAALDEMRARSSFIMVTHNFDEIIRNCDKVIVIGGPKPIVSRNVKETVKQFVADQRKLATTGEDVSRMRK